MAGWSVRSSEQVTHLCMRASTDGRALLELSPKSMRSINPYVGIEVFEFEAGKVWRHPPSPPPKNARVTAGEEGREPRCGAHPLGTLTAL